MIRMNREENTLKSSVKKECANYDTGFKCLGVMIGKNLKQIIDKEKVDKPCLISKGKECEYYNQCIKPIVSL